MQIMTQVIRTLAGMRRLTPQGSVPRSILIALKGIQANKADDFSLIIEHMRFPFRTFRNQRVL